MKLDLTTIQVLKNFSLINQSLYFRTGSEQSTIAPTKTIFAKANLKQSFDLDFAIYDLPRFLSVVSLFKDPDIVFGEKSLQIISGSQKIQYTYADPESIVRPPDKNIKPPRSDIQFTLTPDIFASVMKATGALSVPEVGIIGKSGRIFISAFDHKNPTGDTYAYEIGETEKSFRVIFKAEYMKMIPSNYNVSISSDGIAYFKSDIVEYWITVEGSSSFNG